MKTTKLKKKELNIKNFLTIGENSNKKKNI